MDSPRMSMGHSKLTWKTTRWRMSHLPSAPHRFQLEVEWTRFLIKTQALPPIYAAQHPMYPAKKMAQGNNKIESNPERESLAFCGLCWLGIVVGLLFSPFSGFCLAQCISRKGRRGIFIGCTISSIVLGVLLLTLGYVLSYQTYTTSYCASYSYSYGWYCSYYGYYYNSLYSSGTIISLYVFGGLFLGVGIILLAVGGYLIWSGKLFNETTRVQPAMVQNVWNIMDFLKWHILYSRPFEYFYWVIKFESYFLEQVHHSIIYFSSNP